MTQAITTGQLPEHIVARLAAQRGESMARRLAAIIMTFSFLGAAALVGPMNEIRRHQHLVIDPSTVKGLPPGMSLLGKLGTFRALAIDWAFIRADRLKEEGKYYEAYELHKTICRLAPRFAKVWDHASWNMAYNISVAQYTPQARWQWVQNGIKVLRDEGIAWNPRSVTLYKALAWTYWHKIGDILDDEHLNYKKALAVEMELVLGAQPVALSTDEYVNWFRAIADAPSDLNKLLNAADDAARLASRLRGLGLPPDETLLHFVARHMRPELQARELLANKSQSDPQFASQWELLSDPSQAEALTRLLAAVRSDVLRNRKKLDPDLMLKLMKQYGPLDWRNAFAHTLYWNWRGDELAEGHVNIDRNDLLNNARNILFALNSMVVRGRITLIPNFDEPFDSYVDFMPETRFIPFVYDEYMRLGKKYFGDDPRFVEGTPGPNYFNGFVTNMHNWIQFLYMEGGETNVQLAENYYSWLREYNPDPNGETQERYRKTLDEFVMDDIKDQMSTSKAANGILRSFIDRAFKYLSLGQTRAGLTSLIRARSCYEFWQIDTRSDPNERRAMQPFELLVRDQLQGFMKQPDVGSLWKARLWKGLPLEWRQMAYDFLQPYFAQLCAAQDPPWSIEAAFGEPPGMDEYRASEITIRGMRREDVEQGEGKKNQ